MITQHLRHKYTHMHSDSRQTTDDRRQTGNTKPVLLPLKENCLFLANRIVLYSAARCSVYGNKSFILSVDLQVAFVSVIIIHSPLPPELAEKK